MAHEPSNIPPSSPSDADREDRALIEAAQRLGLESSEGREACGKLLLRQQGRLFGVCFRMLGNRQEAEELTQESMVKVIKGLDSYDGRAGVGTWTTRIAMNACLSYLRKQKLRKHTSLDALTGGSGGGLSSKRGGGGGGGGLSLASDERNGGAGGGSGGGGAGSGGGRELGPEERVELHERSVLVSAALGRVSAEHRAILVLRDVQGLEYEQIGEVLDLNVGTVKSRLFRARAALRSVIEQLDHGRDDGGDTAES